VPKKISVARLPVTGSDVFGQEEDISLEVATGAEAKPEASAPLYDKVEPPGSVADRSRTRYERHRNGVAPTIVAS